MILCLLTFQQCAINPQSFIRSVLDEMKVVFTKHYKLTMGKKPGSVAEYRFNMAVKLYYRVMEFLLCQVGLDSVVCVCVCMCVGVCMYVCMYVCVCV